VADSVTKANIAPTKIHILMNLLILEILSARRAPKKSNLPYWLFD